MTQWKRTGLGPLPPIASSLWPLRPRRSCLSLRPVVALGQQWANLSFHRRFPCRASSYRIHSQSFLTSSDCLYASYIRSSSLIRRCLFHQSAQLISNMATLASTVFCQVSEAAGASYRRAVWDGRLVGSALSQLSSSDIAGWNPYPHPMQRP